MTAGNKMRVAALVLSILTACITLSAEKGSTSLPLTKQISKIAAESCDQKVKRLETHAASPAVKRQTTKISESEINSYLALELSQKYHPSLKSILVTLEESKLQSVASIDFDQLGMNSTKFLAKLASKMFSGVHNLSLQGKLLAKDGKANFRLEAARFDDNPLPNFLVEEIISAVGRKQKPPFDPMQPSKMPYGIERVDLHAGYLVIHQ